ncbi:MAG: hypothetical protein NC453_16465 [Muribaculum sp.]|nr:hypothetical protein [Muribaculum sp.]
MELREIILFCYGDSSLASTWSNVPYLMSREFERRGITLHRIDISCHFRFVKLINIFLAKFGFGKYYSFNRTKLFRKITQRKIQNSINAFPNSQLAVFLCMDFCDSSHRIPSMIFSDWTFKQLLERNNYKPTVYEKQFIEWQQQVIEEADIVMPLFDTTYNYLRYVYPQANIVKADYNVVNNMCDTPICNLEELIKTKHQSNYILFIGSKAYIPGLKLLIDVIKDEDNIIIEIIGMTRDVMPDAPLFCHFNGYLRKDNLIQNEQYYSLLKGARFVCNPTPLWGAYSSTVEAMYFYNPIVVAPYEQFVLEFGRDADFVRYTENGNLRSIITNLFALNFESYRLMAVSAHNRVENYTWDHFVDNMIDIISKQNKPKIEDNRHTI